ncbi:MAG TPA: hypothetical protein VIT00_13225 [Terrimicrobiaceae bacterium]
MTPSQEDFDKNCLVCGKSLENGGGFARLKVEEGMIALCCPLCVETYHANPPRYLAKLALPNLRLLNLRPPGASDHEGIYP